VLKRRKLKRGSLLSVSSEKSLEIPPDGVVLGKTLESRQAQERGGSSTELLARLWWRIKTSNSLRKEKEGCWESQ
jgi:hypothetical protein